MGHGQIGEPDGDEGEPGVEGRIGGERARPGREQRHAGRDLEKKAKSGERDGDAARLGRVLAVEKHLEVEYGDAADNEGGAQHVQDVDDQEQPGRVPRRLAEGRRLEPAEAVRIHRTAPYRSSKVLPPTTMRSA